MEDVPSSRPIFPEGLAGVFGVLAGADGNGLVPTGVHLGVEGVPGAPFQLFDELGTEIPGPQVADEAAEGACLAHPRHKLGGQEGDHGNAAAAAGDHVKGSLGALLQIPVEDIQRHLGGV